MKKHYLTILAAALTITAEAQSISPGGIYAAANVSQGNGVSLEWVLGNINAFSALSPLPVRLVRFEGTLTASGDARLDWETTEELNNAGFEIQKATDAKNFEPIGWVDGEVQAQQKHQYHFIDKDLVTTSYYRLKQIDLDGQFTLSKIIRVVPEHESLDRFTAYPNPVREGKVTATLPDRTFKLTLYDTMGRQWEQISNPKAQEKIQLPASGTFLLSIESLAGEKTIKLVQP